MAQADATLIIPRRNFLVRALGFTAAGAALSIPIVTAASAKERMELHAKEFERAFREYYVGCDPRGITNDFKTPGDQITSFFLCAN